MYYSRVAPDRQGDRIDLWPERPEGGRIGLGSLYRVDVELDAGGRRVVPAWVDPEAFDPFWMAPAERHPDGSITVRAPIPEPLFIDRDRPRPRFPSPQDLASA